MKSENVTTYRSGSALFADIKLIPEAMDPEEKDEHYNKLLVHLFQLEKQNEELRRVFNPIQQQEVNTGLP